MLKEWEVLFIKSNDNKYHDHILYPERPVRIVQKKSMSMLISF